MGLGLSSLPIARLHASGGLHLRDVRQVVAYISSWRPLTISTDDASGYRHPFNFQGRWDEDQKRWEINFAENSYVAGREILCPLMPIEEVGRDTLERAEALEEIPDEIKPLISEAPWLPIPDNLRAVGTDAIDLNNQGEAVPEFFLEKGVVSATEVEASGSSITKKETATSADQRRGQRLLRACDIVLGQPRPRARLLVDDKGNVGVTVDAPEDWRPFIKIQPAQWSPPDPAGESLAAVVSALVDEGRDWISVGRCWLLSQPGQARGSEPDETWQFFNDQDLYWNLNYASSHDVENVEPFYFERMPPVGGSIGGELMDRFMSYIESDIAAVESFLKSATVRGEFWTV